MSSLESDLEYFNSIPWCAKLLKDPEFILTPTLCRILKPSDGDELFARILATSDTIPAFLTQYRKSRPSSGDNGISRTQTSEGYVPVVREVRSFVALAAGLNGYPGVLHGGMVASLIDEVAGFLLRQNFQLEQEDPSPGYRPPGWTTVTSELNVKFRRPVPTGAAVVVRAWFDTIEGANYRTRIVIEDSDKRVLSQGEAVFVGIKPGREGAFKI